MTPPVVTLTPEEAARQSIAAQVVEAGWVV